MRKQLILVTLLLLLPFTGCKRRVKIYTKDDAINYNDTVTKASNAEMVSMEQVNGDTIWTFKEKNKRGLSWQIIDDHYMNSFSTMENNELITNYDAILIDYYFNQYEHTDTISLDFTTKDGYIRQAIFTMNLSNREEFANQYQEIQKFFAYVSKENLKYSQKEIDYDVDVCVHADYYQQFYTGYLMPFEELESDYLQAGIVYGNPAILDQFSLDEIDTANKQLVSIYLRQDEELIPTDLFTYPGQQTVSSNALFDYLQTYEDDTLKIEGSREDYQVMHNDEEPVTFQDEMISFFDVEKYFGIQLTTDQQ